MIFLLIPLVFYSSKFVEGFRAPTRLLINRIGPCLEESQFKIDISEMSVSHKNHSFVLINGQVNVTQDIENGWSVKAVILKCNDIRNLDTCDYFISLPVVSDGCIDEGSIYKAIFNHTTPNIMSCPLKKGAYKIKEYPISTENNFLAITQGRTSSSMFGYTYRVEGFDEEENKIFCLESYLQLRYKRDHDWIKTND